MNLIQKVSSAFQNGQVKIMQKNAYENTFNPIELVHHLKQNYSIQVIKKSFKTNEFNNIEFSFIGQFQTMQVFTKQNKMLTLYIVNDILAFVELKPHTFVLVEIGGQ